MEWNVHLKYNYYVLRYILDQLFSDACITQNVYDWNTETLIEDIRGVDW